MKSFDRAPEFYVLIKNNVYARARLDFSKEYNVERFFLVIFISSPLHQAHSTVMISCVSNRSFASQARSHVPMVHLPDGATSRRFGPSVPRRKSSRSAANKDGIKRSSPTGTENPGAALCSHVGGRAVGAPLLPSPKEQGHHAKRRTVSILDLAGKIVSRVCVGDHTPFLVQSDSGPRVTDFERESRPKGLSPRLDPLSYRYSGTALYFPGKAPSIAPRTSVYIELTIMRTEPRPHAQQPWSTLNKSTLVLRLWNSLEDVLDGGG